MARSYRVSVNGKSYDVVVEEIGASASIPPAPAISVTTPAAPAAAVSPAPSSSAPTAPAAVAAGSKITAPMPGKIWKMHVREGDTVANGQLVLVLEAMKMENEIFAVTGGKVVQINCKEGDSVNTGDVLVVIG
ncbi:MAG: biotin/lipoyl-binding protein [Synergistaceae bacterium]|jgi:glutaconyl-CoA decarboxylase|nr:biotin/lipoyl-binding protein [Synergistaceae bacterium]